MKTNEIKETIVFNYNDPIDYFEKAQSYLENNNYHLSQDLWKIFIQQRFHFFFYEKVLQLESNQILN